MSDIFKNILIIIGCLLTVFVGRSTVIEAFRIPSESMVPTLHVNDYILVWKLSYGLHLPFYSKTYTNWRTPRRGDPVVFLREDDSETEIDESRHYMIKRVIGVPNDVVEVQGKQVLVNNTPLTEDYAIWRQGGITEGNFGPIVVPQNHLFVLGDNRDHSSDSRFWGGSPFVSIDLVVGKAFLIYFSTSSIYRTGTFLK